MVKTYKNIFPSAVFEVQLISDIGEIRGHISSLKKILRKNVSDSNDDVDVIFVKFEEAGESFNKLFFLIEFLTNGLVI